MNNLREGINEKKLLEMSIKNKENNKGFRRNVLRQSRWVQGRIFLEKSQQQIQSINGIQIQKWLYLWSILSLQMSEYKWIEYSRQFIIIFYITHDQIYNLKENYKGYAIHSHSSYGHHMVVIMIIIFMVILLMVILDQVVNINFIQVIIIIIKLIFMDKQSQNFRNVKYIKYNLIEYIIFQVRCFYFSFLQSLYYYVKNQELFNYNFLNAQLK
ncbi:unnamed protein product [Paramecium pentaurelia]|uniref:Transmembrane protein n=1 Tax=Paramecium pentaurelia TaxID=43138 RepID=A0A8S1WGA0_9CILI|nr:unnamed protein product [Paramecium pentaurelia]